MFIKICGITNLEDAQNAALFGATAIGFVFAKSPRQVTPEEVRKITSRVNGALVKVGVFVNEKPERVNEIINFCGLNAVQLHGEEPPDYCSSLNISKVIKAFRIKNEASLLGMGSYSNVFAYLLDTFSNKQYGGTGKTFDWHLAVKAKKYGKPVILSGGLGINTIKDAIRTAKPYGVDISSSIELEPGKKNDLMMKELISSIKDLDCQNRI